MLNCLKSDFYRMFKSKTTYILLGVLAGLSLFSVIIYKVAGIFLDEAIEQFSITGKDLFVQGLAGNTSIFLAVFVSIFICNDFSSGMMKSYVSNTSRTKIFFSKLIVCLTAGVILILTSSILSGSLGSIFFGYGEFAAVNISEYLVKFLLSLLFVVAYVSIFIFIAFAIRSTGGVISVNLLITMLISTLLVLLALVPALKNIGDYWLENNFAYAANSIYPEGLKDHLLSILLTGAAYTAVFLPSAYLFFRYKDVK